LETALAARAAVGPLVLDGVPRLADQVGRVRALLGREPTAVIVLEVPTPIAIDRLMNRTTCEACDWPHGSGWPSSDGRCTQCGGTLTARADDTVAGIERRHETWGMEARGIVRYYEGLGVDPVRVTLAPRLGSNGQQRHSGRIRRSRSDRAGPIESGIQGA
jgi:adenylate kinase family enzyme